MLVFKTAAEAREHSKLNCLSWGFHPFWKSYRVGTVEQLQNAGCTGIVPAGWCCTEWPDCDCGARDNEDHIEADKWASENEQAYANSRLMGRLAEMKGGQS